MRRFQVWFAAGVLVGVLGALPRSAAAQGFSVNEHGSCAMGRAGTGVASPCKDGSGMFFNPAGIGLPTGVTVASVGSTFIVPSGDFTDATTGEVSTLEDHVYPVPSLYLVHGFSEQVSAGLGVFAPYGLATEWPENSQGRFLGYYSNVKGIYVQPTVAIALGKKLTVGLGADLGYAEVGLKQHVDLSEQEAAPGVTFANLGVASGTDFADASLDGTDLTMGYHLGAIYQVTSRVSVGVRYMSKQTADVSDGEATFEQIETGLVLAPGNPLGLPAGTPIDALVAGQFEPGGSLVDQTGTVEIPFPAQLSIGVTLKATDKWTLLVDMQKTYWEAFDVLPLSFELLGDRPLVENFGNTIGWRFGTEYAVSPKAVVRLGFITHDAAAPDETVTPNLPEGPRSEFTAGFGTRFGESLGLDLAYQYIDQADREGRTGDGGLEAPTTDVNNGVYQFSAHLFGLTLSYTF
jgi:long-chain fatty acid transport protein